MLHTGVGDLEFRSVYFVCLELFITRTHSNNNASYAAAEYIVAGFCRTAAKLVASCLIEVFYFSLLRMDLIALFVTVNFGDDFAGIVKYVSK